MAEVILDRVSKVYGGETVAVREMNLEIPDGEFVVFVGPSGCGKSTALRMIAGLEEATTGEIYIGDRVVNGLPPRERDVAMVFQNYALYPHMNVYDNLAFALKLQRIDKREIEEKVGEAARILGIEDLLQRKPRALSGGQRQRVALGRAIVRDPAAFLMDEPLSNLDAKLRAQMRTEISDLHDRLETTTVYVTHDQTEAMTMADRVVVLKDGVVQQMATPQRTYDHPENVFVAGFMGSPAMNFVKGRVERKEGRLHALFGGKSVPLSKESRREAGEYAGREVTVGIRPEHIEDSRLSSRNGESSYIEAKPTLVESMGSEKYVHFGLCGESLVARVSGESGAVRGETMRLSIDSRRIHLFDPEGGEAIL